MIFDESVGLGYAPNINKEEEMLECYECECTFKESELEQYDGVNYCKDCLKSIKLESCINYNECYE
jgi:hypothetical protein